MTGVFHVVLIVGIIDDTLHVALIIAYLDFDFVDIAGFFHNRRFLNVSGVVLFERIVFLKQEVVVGKTCYMYLFYPLVQELFQFLDIISFACRDKDTIFVHAGHPCFFQLFERNILPCPGR